MSNDDTIGYTEEAEPNSFGYRGGILSKKEGFMEQCVDEIRAAKTSLEAISILGTFVDKENESLKQSLRELIDVAEKDLLRYAINFHNDYSTTVSAVVIKRAKAAIDRAKSKLQ